MFTIACLITGAINSIFGVVVFIINPRRRLYQVWLGFSLVAGMWAIGYGMMVSAHTEQSAYFWLKWFHYGFGAIFLPAAYLHFTLELIERSREYKRSLIGCYIVAGIFFCINLLDQFVRAQPKFNFNFYTDPLPAYWFYTAWFMGAILYALWLLITAYRNTSGVRRSQVAYQIVATVVGFGGGSMSFFYVFNIDIYPIGVLWNFTYTLFMSYAIVRYRLLDIRVAAVSTSILLVVYSITLGIPFYLYYRQHHFYALIFMGVLATFGPFVYIFLQKHVNDVLLAEQRKYHNTLIQASSGMGHIKDLRKLVKLIVRIIMRALKPSLCAIYVLRKETGFYSLGASLFRNKQVPLLENFREGSKLIEHISKEGQPVLLDEMRAKAVDKDCIAISALALEVASINAAMLVPSIINGRMVAFLVLGQKSSGATYTSDDINVFTILANQSALAIENAQFYDEVRKSHEQLYQAEKLAIIGTIADGIAHQINNRFNTLSFIIDDLLDSIKSFQRDPSKVSAEQLVPVLESGFKSMIGNVIQGGAVVQGLLNYARQTQTKKTSIDLRKLIEDSLQMVALKIRLADIRVQVDIDHDAGIIYGNAVQLQEVFFNIIDNAHYSMIEKRNCQPDLVPTIIFKATGDGDTVTLTVSDNGMGIKPEDQKKLFTPFFTTKASSRKGNGLGLFVMQKIIQYDHGGRISFQSEYTNGVAITIVLPVLKGE